MSTSFTRTREQLARMVLRKHKTLASGGSDVSVDMDIIYEAVDLRLKSMHTRGIFWRKVDKVPFNFSLSAGIVSASATSDILFPISMTVPDGSADSPVEIIGVREYAAISDKTETGLPEKALWKGGGEFLFWPVPDGSADSPVEIIGVREYAAIADKTETGLPEKAIWKGGGEFLFWPVPDTAGTAKLVYEKIADDTSAGAAPDVEVSMLRWLKDIIAYDTADDFYQSEQTINRFAGEAVVAERNIRSLNDQRVNIASVPVDEHRFEVSRRSTDYGA